MILLYLLSIFSLLSSSMQSAAKEAKSFGKTQQPKVLSQAKNLNTQDFVQEENKGKTFNSENAKSKVLQRNNSTDATTCYLQSEPVQSNKLPIEDEYFLEKSETIFINPEEIKEAQNITFQTCHQKDAPYPLSVTRELHVDVEYIPGVSKEEHVCNGHWKEEKFSKLKSAKRTADKWRQEFASDSSIATFQVEVHNKGALHKHSVKASWSHQNNATTCNYYQTQLKEMTPSEWKETNEMWIYSNDNSRKAISSPYCTFIEKTCLDATPVKTINGKEVKRQCWKEQLTFLCQRPNTENCPYFKDANCELIHRECLEKGIYGCTLWELTFRCYSNFTKRKVEEGELYLIDEENEQKPNESFSEVAAKLAVFQAIKEDLETIEATDASKVHVLKGQAMECGKTIVDNIIYDCCFGYSGLAKELGLKKCSKEEMTLAEMRAQGLCHYVGAYEKEFLGLWKTRDQHVFCCFGTKLARILHENARDQLHLGWNEPEKADCRGLTLDEISKLNFSEMDFSELYADYEGKLPKNLQEKLKSFADNIEQKVKDTNE